MDGICWRGWISFRAARTVYYRVRAVDAWGNRSPPSAALAVAEER
ncbi:MAG: hypothetical protein ACOX1P_11470 [Thermoguttaceae bacterium]|jgi:hypothetical protein